MAARASRRPPLATLARRWLAVVLVAVIGYAYYHPIKSWIETRHELSARRAEVGRLANEKRALQDRLQVSASSDASAGALAWTRTDSRSMNGASRDPPASRPG